MYGVAQTGLFFLHLPAQVVKVKDTDKRKRRYLWIYVLSEKAGSFTLFKYVFKHGHPFENMLRFPPSPHYLYNI